MDGKLIVKTFDSAIIPEHEIHSQFTDIVIITKTEHLHIRPIQLHRSHYISRLNGYCPNQIQGLDKLYVYKNKQLVFEQYWYCDRFRSQICINGKVGENRASFEWKQIY